jgi:hypothetical protein
MSKADQSRVFNVAPEGVASIDSSVSDRVDAEVSSISSSTSPDEVIFLTHILSLKTAALIHLGVIHEAGESVDLETAKQIIDTLEVLKKRTAGNLSYEERQWLDASTHELKMAYLSAKS